MTTAAVVAAILLVAALPANAQTTSLPATGSTGGGVGSASLRNGYPAAGGAVVLPTLPNFAAGAAPSGTAGTRAVGGPPIGGGAGGGGGRGTASANTAAGGASGSRRASGSGGNFVLCPPSGASGEAAFLIGTDLSCAPQ